MSTPIITVDNLSKRYQLGQIGATTLRESVERFVNRVRLRKTLDHRLQTIGQEGDSSPLAPSLKSKVYSLESDPQDFWALKDVSFEVQPGEVLGIIGRNGAGKSTLLKILSRITEPSSGRAIIRGRVASLLEVGTGFHPELSGRENIYLNGAILGMKHAEISRKFDEIVAFSEVERFIDTPVKHYSSGMYVRLAFAVAAHLEPEILIVDEVLAVGDGLFQKKCINKMGDVARQGRTVLFVSHTMGTIASLCGKTLLMNKGRLVAQGLTRDIISMYLFPNSTLEAHQGSNIHVQSSQYPFVLHSVEVVNMNGDRITQCGNDDKFSIRFSYELLAPMRAFRVGFRLHAQDGTVVLSTTDCDHLPDQCAVRSIGKHISEVIFPSHLLNSGSYYLWVGVDIPMVGSVLVVDQGASFTIQGIAGVAVVNDKRLGVIAPLLPWTSRTVTT